MEIKLTPDITCPDKDVTVRIEGGRAFLKNNYGLDASQITIHESTIVEVRGRQNSVLKEDQRLVVECCGGELASRKFTISTWPMSVSCGKSESKLRTGYYGVVAKMYLQSESGSSDDLAYILVGEELEFVPNPPPWPPFGIGGPIPTPPVAWPGHYKTVYGGREHPGVPGNYFPFNDEHGHAKVAVNVTSGSVGTYQVRQWIKFKDPVYDGPSSTNYRGIAKGDFTIDYSVYVAINLGFWKFYGFSTTVQGNGGPVAGKQSIGFA